MYSFFGLSVGVVILAMLAAWGDQINYEKGNGTTNRVRLEASAIAQSVEASHAAAVAWYRDNSTHTGLIVADLSDYLPYGFTQAYAVETRVESGFVVTRFNEALPSFVTTTMVAAELYGRSESPYAGLATNTGVENAGGSFPVTHTIPVGSIMIGDLVND